MFNPFNLHWLWKFLEKRAVDKPPIIETPMKLITPDQLDAVTFTLSKERCEFLADLLNELCTKYGITEELPFRMFLANLLQESGELTHREENMNYSASRIVAVWPSRFKSAAEALPYARNPVALANKVYANRMGNYKPNDGWDFRGGGPIGITGRELYTAYAKYIGKPLMETTKLVRTDDRQALDSACWFFAIYKKLIPVANKGNFKAVCSLINTGSANRPAIGQDIRDRYYTLINAVLR